MRSELPVGVMIDAVSDQPRVVKSSVNEFMKSLVEAVVIVLGVSFVSLGITHWHCGGAVDSAGAGHHLLGHVFGVELQRISLGSLIIALGLLVDDAVVRRGNDGTETGARLEPAQRRRLRLHQHGVSDADRHADHRRDVFAGGLCQVQCRRCAFSLFAVVGLALVISWFVAVLFTPFIGHWLLPERQPNAEHGAHGDVYDKPFYVRFRRW